MFKKIWLPAFFLLVPLLATDVLEMDRELTLPPKVKKALQPIKEEKNRISFYSYLKQNQPIEYTLYDEVKSDYKIPLSVYPKEVIFDLFLNSSQIGALMGSAISMLESWIKKNPNPKLDFHQEEIKRLFDLGLLDPESCFESYLKSYLLNSLIIVSFVS